MRHYMVLLLLVCQTGFSQHITTVFEQSGGTKTPSYSDIIAWWKKLDAISPVVKMIEMGPTDAGFPLHLVIVSADRDFNIASIKNKNRSILFVNNGIHPGEPDGIDATMLLVRDIVEKEYPLPPQVVLAIIPVYNIGGCLNRSKNYRVDQNGPEEFGFRGNSANLDLNRDFIKCDSREAITFSKIFHYLDPDVFVDNHVSNGADYQHIMTLLTTQHNKLGGALGSFLNDIFEPGLYSRMRDKGYEMAPYVNHFGETLEKGWPQFWDSPRYSSGYAALWSTFAFVPETHMLKPYEQRVASTKALEESFIELLTLRGKEIRRLREETKKQQLTQPLFPVAWRADRSSFRKIPFKGYQWVHKKSDVSGLPRLFYDRDKPVELQIPFYDTYIDTLSVKRPKAYLIPQGWWKVMQRLEANGVRWQRLSKDTSLEIEWYKIESYQSMATPFEGHHPNRDIKVTGHLQSMTFRKGDYYIPVNQAANRFLIETLEPFAEDSYFVWNFFDAILGQKEGFSDYHFEDIAAGFLEEHPQLHAALQSEKAKDSTLANSAAAQLNFIYRHSPWMEPAYRRYPVYRVLQ